MSSLRIALRNVTSFLVPHGIYAKYQREHQKKFAEEMYDGEPASFCPVCETTSYFGTFGRIPRPKSVCINCDSKERHRLIWLFFQRKTNLFKNKDAKILHVAAESQLEKRFKKVFTGNYLTADLFSPSAMVKMDITDIKYPDESFDVIICNHVLEHVPDDRKAMSELHRVLKKDGWAVLLVPVGDRDTTYEDFSIKSKPARLKAFGQIDHVRMYGRDYVDRLRAAGFKVDIFTADDIATPDEVKKMSLKEDTEKWDFIESEVYYVTR